jgi:hypothetical protein
MSPAAAIFMEQVFGQEHGTWCSEFGLMIIRPKVNSEVLLNNKLLDYSFCPM